MATAIDLHFDLAVDAVFRAVKAQQDNGNLPGIQAENIKDQDIGDESAFKSFPAVSVYPGLVAENLDPGAGPNQTDDIGYPVIVALMDVKGSTAHPRQKRLGWRRRLQNALQHRNFFVDFGADYDGAFDTRVEPGPVMDQAAWFNAPHLWISQFTVRVFWRELRT